MIEFKIISSPDRSQQATYQHVGKELTFGKSEGDMLIDDPGFGALQLKVVVENDKSSIIENVNAGIEVRLNGKAISGPSPLKEKDNVTVSRTTINFSRLDLTQLPSPEPYENPVSRDRVTPGSKEKAMLDVLAHLEEKAAGAAGQPPVPGAGGPKPPIPPGGGAKPPLPPGVKPPVPSPPIPKKS